LSINDKVKYNFTIIQVYIGFMRTIIKYNGLGLGSVLFE